MLDIFQNAYILGLLVIISTSDMLLHYFCFLFLFVFFFLLSSVSDDLASNVSPYLVLWLGF
jgi:hypothetical protein